MKWFKVFLIVSLGALMGMVMGALFGFVAGHITPDFFERRSGEWGPIGYATVLGGKWGVKCGGVLAVFGIIIQVVSQWIRRDAGNATATRAASSAGARAENQIPSINTSSV